MKRIFNFSAGPSSIPSTVIKKIKKELFNWKDLHVSVMEVSHRNENFFTMLENMKKNLREIMNIPKNYKILFCTGSGRSQFSAVPMNLISNTSTQADYVYSGIWSKYAIQEAKKYCKVNIINIVKKKGNKIFLSPMKDWNITKKSVYIHYCANETIEGLSIEEVPIFKNKILVADFSSSILSHPINIKKFGIIYAASQKNIGISGFSLVIIREDLLKLKKNSFLPSFLNYQIIQKKKSLFNTPSTFSWYVANLVIEWIKSIGITNIYKMNQEKSKILYSIIDKYKIYQNHILPISRSKMNVVFFIKNKYLQEIFLKMSMKIGLLFLKGHAKVGGIRASLYNAMSIEGVEKLVSFMKNFSKTYKNF
ncbi:3-phosphoserine/phosphohydroxythreonine transaminase [bacterium endosymbiont of Pedicinus badii]|uniref:3-phosphoserine/phosphohydroxythreonine transaminase n=1 Tax=bacterium endosymbiont of Pedicinus badii TaxID=1719126 RepID=UPI0009BC06E6|nr:3-phosphoserine/phosphohydroxythreonine transaminase [bacterium endosymbiont of Pedicinus badii]OQM34344.1 phosphohydroxythreonine aminotransferase [bacterium endosymbiont of Pedicinus badii]